jgi:hypothetical protein
LKAYEFPAISKWHNAVGKAMAYHFIFKSKIMENIKAKLDLITEFWNDFVWKYKMIQSRIVWDEEVKTNYYGDILSYFEDTFNIIIKKPKENNFQESIFYTTGLLQIIYVHQDLTDELLRIFKIAKSGKEDKNPNREIRNELIGHPINKGLNGKFESSIFWGGKLSIENIHYVKYSKQTNFSGNEKSFKTIDIIESHKDFLNKYFDQILERIRKTLDGFSPKIQELRCLITANDFILLVDVTSKIFEDILKSNYLYNEKILKECYHRKSEHIRYKLVVDNFKKDLLQRLDDTQNQIDDLCQKSINRPFINHKFAAPKIIITDNKSNKKKDLLQRLNSTQDQIDELCIEATTKSCMNPGFEALKIKINCRNSNKIKDYDYEIQKLFGKHPIFGVSYFKEQFIDDVEILVELNNMEQNINIDIEYYSSFFYLKTLIKNRINQSI